VTLAATDDAWMAEALSDARAAGARGEVPVGAIVVRGDRVIGRGGNSPIAQSDPTAHAEIAALRDASATLGNYRLVDCALYVTLEPCAMCAGAISLARVGRLVYAAADPKGGAISHGPRFFEQPTCHHRPLVDRSGDADHAGRLLKDFFQARR